LCLPCLLLFNPCSFIVYCFNFPPFKLFLQHARAHSITCVVLVIGILVFFVLYYVHYSALCFKSVELCYFLMQISLNFLLTICYSWVFFLNFPFLHHLILLFSSFYLHKRHFYIGHCFYFLIAIGQFEKVISVLCLK